MSAWGQSTAWPRRAKGWLFQQAPKAAVGWLPFWGAISPLYPLLPLLLTLLLLAQGRGINLLLTRPPSQQAGGAPGGLFPSCPQLSPQHGRGTGSGLDEVGSGSQLGSSYAANHSQQLHLAAFVSRHSCVPGTGEDGPLCKTGLCRLLRDDDYYYSLREQGQGVEERTRN